MAPEFHHYDAADIPRDVIEDIPTRVLMGTAYGLHSPVKTFADTLYVEAQLQAGQSLTLPDTVAERAVYVVSGQLHALETVIDEHAMAIFAPQPGIQLTAAKPSRIAIIGGETLSPRHIWWNFVSSRKDRIEQARSDWRNGNFPTIPGDDREFIPLPENG